MERADILAGMGELELYGMRGAYDAIIAAAVKRQREPQRVIGDFVSAEVAEKQARSTKHQIAVPCRSPIPWTCTRARCWPANTTEAAAPRSRGVSAPASRPCACGAGRRAMKVSGAATDRVRAAPLGGRLEALAKLVAEHRDAALAEYADMLAARPASGAARP